jgi:hypothetical protein
VARGQSGPEVDAAESALAPIVASIDLTTLDSRQQALRDLCRLAGELNTQAVRESTHWSLLIGVWAQTATGEETVNRKKIKVALLSASDAFTRRIEGMYGAMATLLGLRLREQFTLRDFVVAADSLSEGLGLRDRLDETANRVIVRPTGPNWEPESWTVFAVALEGLVHQFFEFDPDWAPPNTKAG